MTQNPSTSQNQKTILIVGASRGLGCGLAEEFVKKNWHIVGTVRDKAAHCPFSDLAKKYPENISIEELDINHPDQIKALRQKLKKERFDILFVNAGIMPDRAAEISDITNEDFNNAMLTNALSPMRVLDSFEPLAKPNGLIGAMTSRMGSIGDNGSGGLHLYRSSKTALNQLMRNFEHSHPERALVLMHPGWVATDMGGSHAPFTLADSVVPMANTLISLEGKKGLRFVNYKGETLPW